MPNDFVFTVDGKKMTVADLKAGMKGTATVTTTTTVTPVVVTELRSGVVLTTGPNSVTVLDRSDGVRKKFTRDQLNARASRSSRRAAWSRSPYLVKGDDIVATIVSQGPPEVVTEQEVQATLAQGRRRPLRKYALATSLHFGNPCGGRHVDHRRAPASRDAA